MQQAQPIQSAKRMISENDYPTSGRDIFNISRIEMIAKTKLIKGLFNKLKGLKVAIFEQKLINPILPDNKAK